MFRIIEKNKYYKNNVVYNENFGKVLDFAIETILNRNIKEIRFGAKWQYLKVKGKPEIRAFLLKKKNRNQKSLILKGKNFEIECLTEYWDEIRIRKKGIDIEEVGLFIDFENPINNLNLELK